MPAPPLRTGLSARRGSDQRAARSASNREASCGESRIPHARTSTALPSRDRRRCGSRSAPRSRGGRLGRELDRAQPLGALPEVLAGHDEAHRPAVVGGQRLAVGVRDEQSAVLREELVRDVRREAVLGVGDRELRACAVGRQSFAISLQGTPSNCASKRLQRVTQWMSCVELARGSAPNCSQLELDLLLDLAEDAKAPRRRGRSSAPGAACSTGHFFVMYWPGGSRSGSIPAARAFLSAIDLNIGTYTSPVAPPVVTKTYVRPRAYVAVTGARRRRSAAARRLERRARRARPARRCC